MSHQAPQHPLKAVLFPVLAGLLTAQLLGTLFVSQSNTALLGKIKALTAAGWLAIPTGAALEPLAGMQSALLGGLFYTLSAGAGLALLAWALMFIKNRLLGGSRVFLFSLLILWLGLLILINSNGPSLYPSLFVTVVPAITALFAPGGESSLLGQNRRKARWLPLIVLILLTGLWSTQLNKNLFITIRDHILLSNPLGRSVNDFYYRNTMYAAEAFKSFRQKTLSTCYLDIPDDGTHEELRNLLRQHDILEVGNNDPQDLRLSQAKEDLILSSPQGNRLTVSQKEFLKDPKPSLDAYSQKNDRYALFRRLILMGLLVGFPCLLYMTVYCVLHTIGGLFLYDRQAGLYSSILCLIIGIGLFIPILLGQVRPIQGEKLNTALGDAAWPVRVAALRYIETHKLEIARLANYEMIKSSSMVVERYWLARALAVSHDPGTYSDLLGMLDDPHPNVVCQAFYALGERGNPAAVEPIKQKIVRTDHWYEQWYGYRAMRRLGWRQTPSKPTP